jgi:hypothetical protein
MLQQILTYAAFDHAISESAQGCLDAAAHTAASNMKRPRDEGPAPVKSRSPRQSPAVKKLRVSQCFESSPQAACINYKQTAVQQLLHATQVTAMQTDHHDMKQTNNTSSSTSAALASTVRYLLRVPAVYKRHWLQLCQPSVLSTVHLTPY